jgi:hypothetical protein
MPGDDRREVSRSHIRDVEAADFPAALHEGENRSLRRDRTIGPVVRLAADPGLIGFDDFAFATHGFGHEGLEFLHALADPVPEEPRGFHAAIQGALDLAGSEAFLAAGHEVDDLQPHMQRDVRRLENRAHPDRERLPAGVAFPKSGAILFAGQPTSPVQGAALRANRTVRPKPRFDIGESSGFTLELGLGKGGLHGGYLLARQSKSSVWSCQV